MNPILLIDLGTIFTQCGDSFFSQWTEQIALLFTFIKMRRTVQSSWRKIHQRSEFLAHYTIGHGKAQKML